MSESLNWIKKRRETTYQRECSHAQMKYVAGVYRWGTLAANPCEDACNKSESLLLDVDKRK